MRTSLQHSDDSYLAFYSNLSWYCCRHAQSGQNSGRSHRQGLENDEASLKTVWMEQRNTEFLCPTTRVKCLLPVAMRAGSNINLPNGPTRALAHCTPTHQSSVIWSFNVQQWRLLWKPNFQRSASARASASGLKIYALKGESRLMFRRRRTTTVYVAWAEPRMFKFFPTLDTSI